MADQVAEAQHAQQAAQQQQRPQQQPESLTTSVGERPKMEVDEGGKKSRSSSSSSSERSHVPSSAQMARTLRQVRSEVDDMSDEMATMRLQLLWAMAEQIKFQRAQAASQVVLQGFGPALEGSLGDALRNRDKFCKDLVMNATKCPEELAKFTASHLVGTDRLSRITIITMQNPSMAGAVLRAARGQRYSYGRLQVTCKKQNCLWDRLIGSPAKAAMTIISRHDRSLQNSFVIDWKAGTIHSTVGGRSTLVAEWHTNVEKGRIRIAVLAAYHKQVAEGMDEEINRLQFGFLDDKDDDANPKGKSKGKSKSKLAKGPRQPVPVDPSAFRKAPPVLRDALGNLTFGRFPFTIAVRKLVPDEGKDAVQGKRLSEGLSSQQAKRRTPTPDRGGGGYIGQVPVVDPWAQARSSTSPAPPMPPTTDDAGRLAAGQTISA